MKQKFIITLAGLVLTTGAMAQGSTCNRSLVGHLTLTQIQLDNWQQGGENSFNWHLNVAGEAKRTAPKFTLKNSIKLDYGQTKVGEGDLLKSADELKLESVFTYLTKMVVNPYVAVSAQSQIAPGYMVDENEDRIQNSAFMDPGFFTESAGFTYGRGEDFTTRLGVALKQTIASEDYGWADDPDTTPDIETLRSETGMESVTDYKHAFNENTLFTTKLELFWNFTELENTDVNWDNTLTAKLTQHIDASFNFKLFYDRDIHWKRQIRQTFGLGISYTFI